MRKVHQKHNKDSICSSENTRIYEYAKKTNRRKILPNVISLESSVLGPFCILENVGPAF